MRRKPRSLRSVVITCAAVTLSCMLNNGAFATERDLKERPQHRRPVALAIATDGRLLFAANRRSGSLSVIDTTTKQVVNEIAVGTRLSDLVLLPDQRHLVVLDEETGQLSVLERKHQSLQRKSAVNVGNSPVSVSLSSNGRRVHVACLWARQLSIVDVSDPSKPTLDKQIDLPFCPRAQRLLADGKTLLVANAFGGDIAVVDVVSGEVLDTRQLEAHNVRELALSRDGKTLLVPHQSLDAWRTTTHFSVHWGEVLLNAIQSISVRALLDGSSESPTTGILHYLGDPDNAAGDPTGILVTADGRQVVSLAGVSEIAISDRDVNEFTRIKVGQRPTAMVLSPDHQYVYVANTHSDSVSVVDVKSARLAADISLGPQAPWTFADRGEQLFYDSRLSSDGWFSCHSCHTDGHSNGHLNDNMSDETVGAPKRVLSLLGVAHTTPWAWNGNADNLRRQIRKSIEVTMQGSAPSDEQLLAIEAYLWTLSPAPPLARARGRLDTAAVDRGRMVFGYQGCVECHEPPRYTSGDAYDVDIADEVGRSQFNPPSLRGVSQRDRLFHDNRARGVHDVLTRHEHGLTEELTRGELEDLLTFLDSL